jgi:NhaP-type Na+/H+ and K+/H+ antiporter
MFRRVVPEGHENVFILTVVLALFQVSNALLQDTGIPAVIAAGVVVGNVKGIRVQRELFEFKEQLTVMLIGLLFILLAADVRLDDVYALGARGALAVGALLFLLRPLAVFVSTWGSEVSFRQKLFMSWIGPRGVVAAAIASLFAVRLSEQNYAGGAELRALVFAVIAVSVLSAGVFGGLVGRWLGVRHTPEGWVVLGANPVALEVALSLQRAGEDVVCIDRDAKHCRAAEQAGISTLCGNGLEQAMMLRAGIEHRLGALAITPNDEVNYLFVKRVTEATRLGTLAAAVDRNRRGVAVDVGSDQGSDVLFGGPQDVERWCGRLNQSSAVSETWRLLRRRQPMASIQKAVPATLALFLAVRREERVFPVTYSTRFRRGDVARVLLHEESLAASRAALTHLGWVPEPERPD